jgi:hypothetical protein
MGIFTRGFQLSKRRVEMIALLISLMLIWVFLDEIALLLPVLFAVGVMLFIGINKVIYLFLILALSLSGYYLLKSITGKAKPHEIIKSVEFLKVSLLSFTVFYFAKRMEQGQLSATELKTGIGLVCLILGASAFVESLIKPNKIKRRSCDEL